MLADDSCASQKHPQKCMCTPVQYLKVCQTANFHSAVHCLLHVSLSKNSKQYRPGGSRLVSSTEYHHVAPAIFVLTSCMPVERSHTRKKNLTVHAQGAIMSTSSPFLHPITSRFTDCCNNEIIYEHYAVVKPYLTSTTA